MGVRGYNPRLPFSRWPTGPRTRRKRCFGVWGVPSLTRQPEREKELRTGHDRSMVRSWTGYSSLPDKRRNEPDAAAARSCGPFLQGIYRLTGTIETPGRSKLRRWTRGLRTGPVTSWTMPGQRSWSGPDRTGHPSRTHLKHSSGSRSQRPGLQM